ncbi:MAG: hypothetical protein A2672_02080 [Candidatus Wildermuthbacteria bacterium RIFCSPHIGHO2_01_FULL_49_22b]|uniref:UDP-N-acetyl-alpha-D-muramoyl-L-alanyl-L-glutamate epimerase n=1 Tax=Candidatus Wildermuthbacteria bacterium RIFCSPHIGHO2_01_FULL_49_22b TaxID=1802448 RepID=A0A1G2QVQ0_9BACT|nr:MAG: hypothetical protein A2672_02080 [Candidatus Wildermuthbacteria bacterium RIFCSPHIGHO2_01_FULL_49_22b]
MKADELRKKYPKFFYRGYTHRYSGGGLHISFHFVIPPNISFEPRVVIRDASKADLKRIGETALNNLVFHLGLVKMLSYWKATCSPEIVIQAGSLNKQQIAWFKDLILNGMGEYFFENKIDFTEPNFLTITAPGSNLPRRKESFLRGRMKKRTLVPLGGGKDAVVTLELLKKEGVQLRPFLLNQKPEQRKILNLAKVGKPIVVERTIDPKLLELNRKGYLNGHTPFSAYLAFLSVLCAVLFDYKYVALSNERSSNEGNVKYLGKVINHQYSKTYEFEKKFRGYVKKYLSKDIEYFSFLRPLYELQIAKLFAKYPKYFGAFLSCNEAHKTKSGRKKPTGKWCGKCAKCLFVFLVLYPFAGEKRTVAIFKKNILKDKKLNPLLNELTGRKRFKPFECVGTIGESRVALSLCQEKIKSHPLLRAWNTKHFLPPRFEKILKRHYV